MSTTPLQSLVNQFVSDIEQLVRQQVTQDIAKAIGLGGAQGSTGRTASKGKAKAAPARASRSTGKASKASSANGAAKSGKAPAKKAAPAKGKGDGTRRRRTPKEIETLATKIYDYVAKNPGKRAEDIKAALKIPTNEWELPVEKLISTGKLTTSGEKRATTYSTKG